MREIKFRAWYSNNGVKDEMIYFDFKDSWMLSNCIISIESTSNPQKYFHQEKEWWKNISSLMQFTGLKDKNGKEIYEGDFLIDNDSEPMRHRIVWIEDQAKFEIETLEDDKGNWSSCIVDELWNLDMKDFEIIGN